MKKAMLFSLLLSIFGAGFLTAQEREFSNEEKKIIQVIEDESKYFWARDFDAWSALYVHKPYVVWSASTQSGVRIFQGWDAWRNEVQKFFTSDPNAQPYEGVVYKYNYVFRIYKNGAWVAFQQMDNGTKTFETRILEKEGGKWKIAMVQLMYNANEEDDSLAEGGED